jgi:hypothetical protein
MIEKKPQSSAKPGAVASNKLITAVNCRWRTEVGFSFVYSTVPVIAAAWYDSNITACMIHHRRNGRTDFHLRKKYNQIARCSHDAG